jgi:hypothetical protein
MKKTVDKIPFYRLGWNKYTINLYRLKIAAHNGTLENKTKIRKLDDNPF